MGFNPPVPQEDSNWEIRVAVLLSLLIQALLIFLGPTRKNGSCICTRPRPFSFVWLFYLLADWAADLALGLILNNMGNIGGGGKNGASSPIIFAFWTPFLLLHMGGPDTITAYSMEDNELWHRHLIGLLFEVFSAGVIFFCSLRGNPLIHATVLMFVAGIIKYSERTCSLYFGSQDVFRAGILGKPKPGRDYASKIMTSSAAALDDDDVQIVIRKPKPKPNGGEVSSSKKTHQDPEEDPAGEEEEEKSAEARAYDFFVVFRRLFVDLNLSSEQRRRSRDFFLERQPDEALQIVKMELHFIYDMLYTKAPVAHTTTGWVFRSVCSACLVSALVAFFLVDKQQPQLRSRRVDVIITYALLLGALALDLAALLMLVFSRRAAVFLSSKSSRRCLSWVLRWATKPMMPWELSMLGSLELITPEARFLVRKPLLVHQGRRGYYFRSVEDKNLHREKIFRRVKKAALQKKDGHDVVFDFRGSRVLQRLETKMKQQLMTAGGGDEKFHRIMDSVVKIKDFDESLLLWHIATDLLFFHEPIVYLSEYMMYLLIYRPEMLSPVTTGIWLMRYEDTRQELHRFFSDSPMTVRLKDLWTCQSTARKLLLRIDTSEKPPSISAAADDDSKSVLFEAIVLAKALRDLGNKDLVWKLLRRVWTEMLLHAAHKCPGSTHARQLNHGGELITTIWLLMEHMGLGDVYDDDDTVATSEGQPPSPTP